MWHNNNNNKLFILYQIKSHEPTERERNLTKSFSKEKYTEIKIKHKHTFLKITEHIYKFGKKYFLIVQILKKI